MGSTFTPNARLTNLAGSTKSGASGSFNGTDACGARAAVPGVSVPNNGYSGSTAPISGSTGSAPNGIGTEGRLDSALTRLGRFRGTANGQIANYPIF